MHSFIKHDAILIDLDCTKKLEQLYDLYMHHKFDLLGSGFVTMNYQIKAKGVHGNRYTNKNMNLFGKKARKLLKGKCTSSYEAINWFVDYKSGFFFHPGKYNSPEKCRKVIGKIPGVDIKCPWEFGRFYHLVQMAVLAAKEEKYRRSIIIEFHDELIDFWELNPIGKTVQWSAPMDVSIRMVNLLVSYDILTQIDKENYLDKCFRERFEMHMEDSLRFVMGHLEYENGISSNHYLSDLAGIIYAAAYLSECSWTDACLVFGVQELIEQVKGQYYEEGAHFEGSTSYHRLSTEFVLFSTALIYGVLRTQRKRVFEKYNHNEIDRLKSYGRQKYHTWEKAFFPDWYINRLYNMGIFTGTILKDNNEITQVGDNDSGRLIKLSYMERNAEKSGADNVLDHRTLLAAFSGLFVNDAFRQYQSELPLEYSFIRALAGSESLYGNVYDTSLTEYGSQSQRDIGANYSYRKETVIYKDKKSSSLLEGLKINYFSKFGIIIFRSKRMFLSMVIDTARNAKYAGHTHNDRLSIELMVDGQYVTRDPGGYIYTAMPGIRDRFRSVAAHNTIHVNGMDQNAFVGTFGMKKQAKAELLYCCPDCIMACAEYKGILHIREVRICDNQIFVADYANRAFTVSFGNRLYSTGYGELRRRHFL